jgi:purine catabolism regulator
MLTVQSLIGELGLELAAAAHAAESPVRWVHISELEDPTEFLSGGELMLTTGIPLTSAAKQRAFVKRLASHNLAGLGFGTGFGHRKLPKALVDEAEKQDFPLFEVPYSMPFIALTEKAFTRLVNEQYEVLQRGLAIQRRLERLVLDERGLDEIAATISSAVGGTVMICDGRGERIVSRAFRRELSEETSTAIRREIRARSEEGHPFAPRLGGRTRPRSACDRAGRRPAPGLGRDGGRLRGARRLRPADPAAGGCDRGAGDDAPPRRA